MYHLAKEGESKCDFGTPVQGEMCLQAGAQLLEEAKITPGRNYLTARSNKNVNPPQDQGGGPVLLDEQKQQQKQKERQPDDGGGGGVAQAAQAAQEAPAAGEAVAKGGAEDLPPYCSIKTAGDWAVAYESNTKSQNGGKYSMVCTEPVTAVHLAPQGHQECDHGSPVPWRHCLERGKELLEGGNPFLRMIESANAPPGCSIHTASGNHIYFNNDKDGQNDDTYSPVCQAYTIR